MTDSGAGEPSDVDCRRIAELLGDYLEGTLPRPTRELIDWHIEGCAPCVAFINTYRGTVGASRILREVPVPAELKKRLLTMLRARGATTPDPAE
jgi:hypothetical protein